MEPDIKLDGTSIKVADEANFLGLVFDRRLTFRAHVKYLKTVCDKALNVLRVVGHTDWGADKVVLLRLYRALVRSKLDYGCIVYGSESKSELFLELSSSYPNHSKIFTDGSKCNEKVAAAAAADSNFKSPSVCRVPDNCSIYTAEQHAIHLALRLISQSKKKSFLVLSDFLSV